MHVAVAPFLALSILLILIPGPDTAVVTKNALLGGQRAGALCALGVTGGLTIWTTAAALGIAALLEASAVAFFVLKVAGALYLVVIGIQMLRTRGVPVTTSAAAPAGRRAFRQGVLTDLGNPKVAVFFTSFLPQFVHGSGPVFVPLLALGATYTLLTLVWLVGYAVFVARASAFLQRSRVRKTLDRITGLVLIGFGVRLAFEHR